MNPYNYWIKHSSSTPNIHFLQIQKEIVYIEFKIILSIRDQQKYKEALTYYEKSLKIDPNGQFAKIQKEFCQQKLNQ